MMNYDFGRIKREVDYFLSQSWTEFREKMISAYVKNPEKTYSILKELGQIVLYNLNITGSELEGNQSFGEIVKKYYSERGIRLESLEIEGSEVITDLRQDITDVRKNLEQIDKKIKKKVEEAETARYEKEKYERSINQATTPELQLILEEVDAITKRDTYEQLENDHLIEKEQYEKEKEKIEAQIEELGKKLETIDNPFKYFKGSFSPESFKAFKKLLIYLDEQEVSFNYGKLVEPRLTEEEILKQTRKVMPLFLLEEETKKQKGEKLVDLIKPIYEVLQESINIIIEHVNNHDKELFETGIDKKLTLKLTISRPDAKELYDQRTTLEEKIKEKELEKEEILDNFYKNFEQFVEHLSIYKKSSEKIKDLIEKIKKETKENEKNYLDLIRTIKKYLTQIDKYEKIINDLETRKISKKTKSAYYPRIAKCLLEEGEKNLEELILKTINPKGTKIRYEKGTEEELIKEQRYKTLTDYINGLNLNSEYKNIIIDELKKTLSSEALSEFKPSQELIGCIRKYIIPKEQKEFFTGIKQSGFDEKTKNDLLNIISRAWLENFYTEINYEKVKEKIKERAGKATEFIKEKQKKTGDSWEGFKEDFSIPKMKIILMKYTDSFTETDDQFIVHLSKLETKLRMDFINRIIDSIISGFIEIEGPEKKFLRKITKKELYPKYIFKELRTIETQVIDDEYKNKQTEIEALEKELKKINEQLDEKLIETHFYTQLHNLISNLPEKTSEQASPITQWLIMLRKIREYEEITKIASAIEIDDLLRTTYKVKEPTIKLNSMLNTAEYYSITSIETTRPISTEEYLQLKTKLIKGDQITPTEIKSIINYDELMKHLWTTIKQSEFRRAPNYDLMEKLINKWNQEDEQPKGVQDLKDLLLTRLSEWPGQEITITHKPLREYQSIMQEIRQALINSGRRRIPNYELMEKIANKWMLEGKNKKEIIKLLVH